MKSSIPNDPASVARNALLSIVTAARMDDMMLASKLTNEFAATGEGVLPLFISAIALIETMLSTVSEAMDIDADKLFSGICLGISVKTIEEQQRRNEPGGNSGT